MSNKPKRKPQTKKSSQAQPVKNVPSPQRTQTSASLPAISCLLAAPGKRIPLIQAIEKARRSRVLVYVTEPPRVSRRLGGVSEQVRAEPQNHEHHSDYKERSRGEAATTRRAFTGQDRQRARFGTGLIPARFTTPNTSATPAAPASKPSASRRCGEYRTNNPVNSKAKGRVNRPTNEMRVTLHKAPAIAHAPKADHPFDGSSLSVAIETDTSAGTHA